MQRLERWLLVCTTGNVDLAGGAVCLRQLAQGSPGSGAADWAVSNVKEAHPICVNICASSAHSFAKPKSQSLMRGGVSSERSVLSNFKSLQTCRSNSDRRMELQTAKSLSQRGKATLQAPYTLQQSPNRHQSPAAVLAALLQGFAAAQVCTARHTYAQHCACGSTPLQ